MTQQQVADDLHGNRQVDIKRRRDPFLYDVLFREIGCFATNDSPCRASVGTCGRLSLIFLKKTVDKRARVYYNR